MTDIVNATDIGTRLGQALGMGSNAQWGGAIAMGFIFMMIWIFPTIFLCGKRNIDFFWPITLVGLGSLIVSVPLFGFPSWVIIIVIFLIGGLWASGLRNWITGKGTGG